MSKSLGNGCGAGIGNVNGGGSACNGISRLLTAPELPSAQAHWWWLV
jgi:hypothetical protein